MKLPVSQIMYRVKMFFSLQDPAESILHTSHPTIHTLRDVAVQLYP